MTSAPDSDHFGPSALVTPANAVTIARLLIAPIVFAMIGQGPSYVTTVAWVVLAVTDGVDGYVARRQGTTRSGAFLDPLADKVLVLGGLFALMAAGVFWWLPVVLIAGREMLLSLYRTVLGRRGISVPARKWAKIKTVTQELAVGFAILPLTAPGHPGVARAFLWLAAALTLWTGGQYLLEGRRVSSAV